MVEEFVYVFVYYSKDNVAYINQYLMALKSFLDFIRDIYVIILYFIPFKSACDMSVFCLTNYQFFFFVLHI